jgi:hypothetical protein
MNKLDFSPVRGTAFSPAGVLSRLWVGTTKSAQDSEVERE